MTKEKILSLINDIEVSREISSSDCVSLIRHYIFERKGKDVDANSFNALTQIFSLEGMLSSATDYFKSRYNLISLYNKDNILIKVF